MKKTMFKSIENKKKNLTQKEIKEIKILTKNFIKTYEKAFKTTDY